MRELRRVIETALSDTAYIVEIVVDTLIATVLIMAHWVCSMPGIVTIALLVFLAIIFGGF